MKLARILLFCGWAGVAWGVESPELADSLAKLRAVGPEGHGHAEASAAWKKIATTDANSLLPILEAMDGANDLARNWLRPAVDAIASRTLASGASLPLTDLGQFLLDTRHDSQARRLVFDWLKRVDPATVEKVLPGMLNDPCLEIRYDAVQKIIDQGAQLQAATNKSGALLLFQQALNSARDVDQISLVSTNLTDLGCPVDTLKLFNFITQWKIIGPFDNTGRKGFETVFPPEKSSDLNAEYEGKSGRVKWKDYVVTDKYGKLDLNQAYGKLKEVAAYASADFASETAQAVEVRLGCETSWKVWLNGSLLFARDEYHFDSQIDQYKIPAQLRAGHNTILVKVCQSEQAEDWTVDWNLQLRITDSLGTPILPVSMATKSPVTR